MKLSFTLGEAGFIPESLETKSIINFENGSITESHLVVTRMSRVSTKKNLMNVSGMLNSTVQ